MLRELSLHRDLPKAAAHGPDGMAEWEGPAAPSIATPLPGSSPEHPLAPSGQQRKLSGGFLHLDLCHPGVSVCSLLWAGAEGSAGQQPFDNCSSTCKTEVFSWSFL